MAGEDEGSGEDDERSHEPAPILSADRHNEEQPHQGEGGGAFANLIGCRRADDDHEEHEGDGGVDADVGGLVGRYRDVRIRHIEGDAGVGEREPNDDHGEEQRHVPGDAIDELVPQFRLVEQQDCAHEGKAPVVPERTVAQRVDDAPLREPVE